MSRYIDADAYAAEMKTRQDALKELMDDADALDNWEMYDGLSRAFSVFVEAKLTLDAMPTVDAVPVKWIKNHIKEQFECDNRTYAMEIKAMLDWYMLKRADGERKDGEPDV